MSALAGPFIVISPTFAKGRQIWATLNPPLLLCGSDEGAPHEGKFIWRPFTAGAVPGLGI
jgi:hypothetical protein